MTPSDRGPIKQSANLIGEPIRSTGKPSLRIALALGRVPHAANQRNPPLLCEVPVFARPLFGSPINFADFLIGSPITSHYTAHRHRLARRLLQVWSGPRAVGLQGGPHVTQYAAAAAATSRLQMMTKAGSSRAHWFFVCLWYEVCRYLPGAASVMRRAYRYF